MTRRALFAMLAAAVLDPDRLIWRPGAKLISIPKPPFPSYSFFPPGCRCRMCVLHEQYLSGKMGDALAVWRYSPREFERVLDGPVPVVWEDITVIDPDGSRRQMALQRPAPDLVVLPALHLPWL